MLQLDDVKLWSISDVDRGDIPPEASDDLRAIVAWSRSYLVNEHPQLGRSGPVCPYTQTAIDKDLFLLAHPAIDATPASIVPTVLAMRDAYLERVETLDARFRSYLTIVIVLSKWSLEDSDGFDAVQASLKGDFVKQGLMIGQFHPRCDYPGIYNQDFRALRAPIPIMVIRTMVRNDLPFLTGNDEYVEAYNARFG